MVNQEYLKEDIDEQNHRSQSMLERSLFYAPQEFSLLLVRCNYQNLEASIRQQICTTHHLNQVWRQQEAQFSFEYHSDLGLAELATAREHKGLLFLYLTTQSTNLEAILSLVFEHLDNLGVQHDCLRGVMVFGLEHVGRLHLSLALLNQVRDQLSYLLPCPLVLWLTDRGAQSLFRMAPDVKSWAVTSMRFTGDNDHLQRLWRDVEVDCFQRLTAGGGLQFQDNEALDLALDGRRRLELELSRLELAERGEEIPPLGLGFWALINGRDAYQQQNLLGAHEAYLQSLQIYGRSHDGTDLLTRLLDQPQRLPLEALSPWLQERLALLFFHLGLLYDDFAQAQHHAVPDWELGQRYLRVSMRLWSQLERWQWVAHLTTALGLMLRQLHAWDDLEDLAWQTIKKLDVYCSQMLLTRNYGLLAEVAIARRQWVKAEMLAHSAIENYDLDHEAASRYDLPWYFLVLAQAEQHLSSRSAAIAHLEEARTLAFANLEQAKQQRQTWLGWYLRLYRNILQNLHQLHWQAEHYREAFDLQLELQYCEQQWGWRVFFGAAALPAPLLSGNLERRQNTQKILLASRRNEDVKRLLERLSRDEHKLTILHGESGVGKTSLLQAGLVPSLWGQMVNARETLPIMITNYGQWHRQLTMAIATLRRELLPSFPPALGVDPITLLQENGQLNLLTVLVFDQFEEFLEQYDDVGDRRSFFQFLSQCLQLPFVKIILSLRSDHLSYLLEWELCGNLEIINDNILDRAVRYPLGNFSAGAAHNLLTVLSEQSLQPLEPPFIDRLIADLSNDMGEIRPIELQVIGFQLQQNNITTLEKYLDLGESPRQKVLEHFLSQVIHQCGDEHRELAWQFLYHLTNLRQTRPEIAEHEFLKLCYSQYPDHRDPQAITDLILHVFVGSGLVLRYHNGFRTAYQLVHDYLVQPIRHHYDSFQSRQLADRLAFQDHELSRIRRHWGQSIATIGGLLLVVVSMIFLARRAESQRYRQWQVTQNAELMALSNASEALFYSDQQFEALLESLRATVRLRNLMTTNPLAIAPATRLKVLTTLEQSYFDVQEKNRLEGHSDSVFDVNLSPDGQLLASASWDNTVRLWSLEGELLTTMIGHEERVTRVVFAPDGKSLFSSSWDNTVKEWSLTGKELRSIEIDLDSLTAIDLSPDGELLAIASGTGAELRALDGSMTKTLTADREVYWIAFSPDGEEILTVEEGNQLILWNRRGDRLQTMTLPIEPAFLFATFSPDGKTLIGGDAQGNLTVWERGDRQGLFPADGVSILGAHTDAILFISFNTDGSLFATASADDTVKVWGKDFTLQKTFFGHRDDIRSVIFHPRTGQLISGSMDKTIRLWEYDTDTRVVLHHRQPIRDLTFAPDGQTLATASNDKTIRLWRRQDGSLKRTLKGHTDWVNAVAWHPDGTTLISGGDDETVRMWSADGTLIKTLRDHKDRVLDVAWSPNGDIFASASLDRTVRIWSRDGQLLQTLAEHQDRVNSIDFSPDGKLLASASDDRTVKVWQRRPDNSFFLVSQLEDPESWVTDVVFSLDNQYLAFSGYDNNIELLRMSYKNNNPEFEPPIILKGHSDSVAHLQFNPLFPVLATSTWNNQLQFWQLDDTLLKTLEGHKELITALDWSPDGQAIATSSNDNTAIIWELDLEFLLAKSCDRLSAYLAYNPKVRDSDRHLCQADNSEISSPVDHRSE